MLAASCTTCGPNSSLHSNEPHGRPRSACPHRKPQVSSSGSSRGSSHPRTLSSVRIDGCATRSFPLEGASRHGNKMRRGPRPDRKCKESGIDMPKVARQVRRHSIAKTTKDSNDNADATSAPQSTRMLRLSKNTRTNSSYRWRCDQ